MYAPPTSPVFAVVSFWETNSTCLGLRTESHMCFLLLFWSTLNAVQHCCSQSTFSSLARNGQELQLWPFHIHERPQQPNISASTLRTTLSAQVSSEGMASSTSPVIFLIFFRVSSTISLHSSWQTWRSNFCSGAQWNLEILLWPRGLSGPFPWSLRASRAHWLHAEEVLVLRGADIVQGVRQVRPESFEGDPGALPESWQSSGVTFKRFWT